MNKFKILALAISTVLVGCGNDSEPSDIDKTVTTIENLNKKLTIKISKLKDELSILQNDIAVEGETEFSTKQLELIQSELKKIIEESPSIKGLEAQFEALKADTDKKLAAIDIKSLQDKLDGIIETLSSATAPEGETDTETTTENETATDTVTGDESATDTGTDTVTGDESATDTGANTNG